jgi:CelD/BcsL family acetyltransferase involved in cellulose biosynthesis
VNFYASHDYLDVVATTYFPGRRAEIDDYEVDGRFFRLLRPSFRRPITDWYFLDYHEPLGAFETKRARAARVHLRKVVLRTTTIEEWEKTEKARGTPAAFIVDFTGFESYAAYREHVRARARDRIKKNARLRERLAEDVGALEFLVDDTKDDVLSLSLGWKGRQLVETGLSNIFTNPKNVEFFHELRRRGLLRASTLRAGGRLLSAWLGVVHDRVWTGWIFTYDHDPALKRYSLGWQLMESILEESHRSGHRAFDFSVGVSDYKLTYATHVKLLGAVGATPLRERALAGVKRAFQKHPRVLAALGDLRRAIRRR